MYHPSEFGAVQTDFLDATLDPSINFLDAAMNPSVTFLDDDAGADEVAIGAIFEEDEAFAMGLVPDAQYGAVAQGKTPAVSQAVSRLKSRQARQASLARASKGRVAPAVKARIAKEAQANSIAAQRLKGAIAASQQKRAQAARGAFAKGRAAGFGGAGLLDFQVESPPGVGRLSRVPFLVADAVTAGTLSTLGDQTVVVPTGSAASTQRLRTPQISWAVNRIVGIEVTRIIDNPGIGAPDVYQIEDFQLGGGANLLINEQAVGISFFGVGLDLKVGLREYPLLRSPNQAEVTLRWLNSAGPAATTTANNTLVAVELIVDNLADDVFGAHLPGPYARRDAMIRKAIGRY